MYILFYTSLKFINPGRTDIESVLVNVMDSARDAYNPMVLHIIAVLLSQTDTINLILCRQLILVSCVISMNHKPKL